MTEREALEKISRTPSMPFPDPGAHSWRSWGIAVYSAWQQIQITARAALSTKQEGEECLRVATQPSDEHSTWRRIESEKPRPHARYHVRRGDLLFTATPCYGMHAPWWVPRVPDQGDMPLETAPISMLDDDEWIPAAAVSPTPEERRSQVLEEAARRLKDHLFGRSYDLGMVGIGKDDFFVYVHGAKRRWRGPTPKTWEGRPVNWRWNIGPIVAQAADVAAEEQGDGK